MLQYVWLTFRTFTFGERLKTIGTRRILARVAGLQEAVSKSSRHVQTACEISSDIVLRPIGTLQELIAPKHLVFFDAHWRSFGTKDEIATLVSRITRVNASLLRGQQALQEFSCAQKMSWAAHRQTTRVEDRAYSLLGIFSISFSPVYGEGWRAFGRLQEEILKISTDQSIFAWTQYGPLDPFVAKDNIDPNDWSAPHRCSILAPTPKCFHDSSNIIGAATHLGVNGAHLLLAPHMSGYSGASSHILNNPIALVNTGLQVSLLVQKVFQHRNR
jgi:hypothetical protein